MSTPESRKVLEEIQKAKTTLLKQGASGGGGGGGGGSIACGFPTPLQHSVPPTTTTSTGGNHYPLSNINEVHVSPSQRIALQALQAANSASFGSFIATESHFGNAILPVLPRLQDLKPKVEY